MFWSCSKELHIFTNWMITVKETHRMSSSDKHISLVIREPKVESTSQQITSSWGAAGNSCLRPDPPLGIGWTSYQAMARTDVAGSYGEEGHPIKLWQAGTSDQAMESRDIRSSYCMARRNIPSSYGMEVQPFKL